MIIINNLDGGFGMIEMEVTALEIARKLDCDWSPPIVFDEIENVPGVEG